ncbi:MAG: GatB/YqeY domain-containing protein [Bacteroidales bacterium]
MALFEKLNEEIKRAMIQKDKTRLETLRAIKSAFLLAKTEKGAPVELPEEAELKILQKMVKQRKESADIYKSQDRNDLALKELEEASVIETFLPVMLPEEEIEKELKIIIDEVGASSPSDMGKVMGIATRKLAGRADGKMMAAKVRDLLS